MLTDKILIPLIEERDNILDDDMSVIKDEYIIFKDRKKPNLLFLFPKDFFLESPYFYNIFNVSKQIGKEYGEDTLYIIFDKNDEENISYIIGNVKYMDKKFHTKGVILKNKWKKESDILLKMISFILDIVNPKRIVIFNIANNKIIEEILKKIEQNFQKEYFIEKYGKKEFIKILRKTKACEKKEQKIIPYAIGIIICLIIIGGTIFLVNKQNEITQKKEMKQIDFYKKNILMLKKKYYDLNQIYLNKVKFLKHLESKKIYKGIKDE